MIAIRRAFASALLPVALAAMACAPTVAQACVNAVGTDLNGRKFYPGWYATGKELTAAMTESSSPQNKARAAQFTLQQVRELPNFATLTNLGVLLIHQGQYRLAIEHFLLLEKRYPGHHETAANLGTALELAGYDDTALRWIRIGMRRNRDEHYRSEWLHARILESKIALKRDPRYLDRHSVAGLDFTRELIPAMPAMPPGNDGKAVTPPLLERSLSYQLFERVQFVAPKDPVVANLLMDWATLHLVGGSIDSADALYDLAVVYGAPADALMRQRQARVREILRKGAANDDPKVGCAICSLPPD